MAWLKEPEVADYYLLPSLNLQKSLIIIIIIIIIIVVLFLPTSISRPFMDNSSFMFLIYNSQVYEHSWGQSF